MLNVRKILAPTDFSQGAEWAMAYARHLAARTGAELHVLHADVLHGAIHEKTPVASPAHASAMDDLERHTEAFEKRDGLAVVVKHLVSRNVSAAPAILDYAEQENVDVIAIGTHGRRGVRRLLMGSVAEEVVRVAECPVLIVRAPKGARPNSIEIKSILVPIDFSDHSRTALAHAREIGSLVNARVELLHVIEETLHPAFYGLSVGSVYDVDPNIEEKAVNQLRELFDEVPGPYVDASFEAGPGTAARAIVEHARERGFGLIVMGTHGMTGLDHFLLGSTTERVLRRSAAPVFVVKSLGRSLLDQGP